MCILTSSRLLAAQLMRGPYLQAATSDGITIRWRTDVPTKSVVFYGTHSSDFPPATDATPTNEHVVRLSGLAAGTKYFYSIGSETQMLAQGPDCHFVTAPVAGRAASTRIWAIGDSGSLSYGNVDVLSMQNVYDAYSAGRRTDVWLLLGDNAYDEGTDGEYQTNFFRVFSSALRQVAPWPTIGNHETYSTMPDGRFDYLDVFSFLTNGQAGGVPSDTPNYYSFDYANIHFVSLDAMTQSRATNGPMANWLRADLDANTNQWLIAFWHHPPYSKGSHDSDDEIEMIEMRQNIVPILESHGADLVLCGHSHDYERSFMLHGHYGFSTTLQPSMILDHGTGREDETGPYIKPTSGPLANQGTVYVVAGDSASCEGFSGHHPAMCVDDASIGSLVVDINSNRLDAVFLRCTGKIGDSFTIIKGPPAPLQFCNFFLQNGNVIAQWKSVGGQTYQVERTDDLNTANWQPVGTTVLASGSTTSWTNAIPGDAMVGYYRVAQLGSAGQVSALPLQGVESEVEEKSVAVPQQAGNVVPKRNMKAKRSPRSL
jgi:hypothetical protein